MRINLKPRELFITIGLCLLNFNPKPKPPNLNCNSFKNVISKQTKNIFFFKIPNGMKQKKKKKHGYLTIPYLFVKNFIGW